jgi:hypothetical protein
MNIEKLIELLEKCPKDLEVWSVLELGKVDENKKTGAVMKSIKTVGLVMHDIERDIIVLC